MGGPTETGKPAGRRRFWITVLCFALLNAAGWLAWHRAYGPGPRNLLRVEQFLPGDRAAVGGRPTLSWRFNLDVGREGPAAEAPVVMTPAVAGKWAWGDARTLLFTPEHDLPRATRIGLKLAPGKLRTPEGFGLDKPYEVTITTTPLRVVEARQAAAGEDDRFVIELHFNDRVLPADVLAKLSLRDSGGRAVEFQPYGDGADRVVRVQTSPLPPGGPARRGQRQVVVQIAAGLAGLGGPLGLEQAYEAAVTLDAALAATDVSAECPPQQKPSLNVRLNGPVDLESARQVVSVEPAVKYALTGQGSTLKLTGDFEPNTRYAVRIAAPPAGADRKKFPRPDTLSALVPDRSPGLWFAHADGYLSSDGNRTLLAHAVNVRDLKVAVWRVYDGNLVGWRNAGGRYAWNDTTPFSRPVVTRKLAVQPAKNAVQDVRLDLNDLLPPGEPRDGVYRVTLDARPSGDTRPDEDDGRGRHYGSYSAASVVTLSDIGLTAKQARDAVTVWAVSLRSAEPLAGVAVRVFSDKNQLLGEATTNADGLATITGVRPADGERAAVVLAHRPPATPAPPVADLAPEAEEEISEDAPDDAPEPAPPAAARTASPARVPSLAGLTWLDLRASGWDVSGTDISGRPYLRQGHEAFVYTERGVYRPGETVHLRAIVRAPGGATPGAFPVRWQVRRPDLRDYRAQVMTLDADGAAGLTLELPHDIPTGRWSAAIGLPGEGSAHAAEFGSVSFQVEEFIPNRVRVALRVGDERPPAPGPATPPRIALSDKPVPAAVQADYLFGRPAAGLEAKLTARLDPSTFQPAKWGGWTFGDSANAAHPSAAAGVAETPPGAGSPPPGLLDLKPNLLDDKGRATWDLDVRQALRAGKSPHAHPGPWRLSVAASVQEAGGRAVTSGSDVQLDALPHYVGVRPAAVGTPRPQASIAFDVALVAPSGQPVTTDAALEVDLFRETWNTSLVARNGRYHYQSTRVLEPAANDAAELPQQVNLAAGSGACAIAVQASGSYVLRLKDPKTGAVTSTAFVVSDGTPWDDNVSREHPERLEVTLLPSGAAAPSTQPADEKRGAGEKRGADENAGARGVRFRTGETAQVLVRSPFAGRLLLAVETDGVLLTRVIDMPASQVTVPVDVTDACRPNAYVSATVVRAVQPDAKWRTHRAYGATRLAVDPADRRLGLKVTAAAEIRPRQKLAVEVRATTPQGTPAANAAVTVAAVDEGILQLTGFATPDPLGFFFGVRALAVQSADLYSHLMPEVARPDKVSPAGGDKGGGDTGGRHLSPVVAKRVRSVSLVSPVFHTDAAGVARAELEVPEFAGRLRLMVVGHAADAFGSAEAAVLVRSPLLVQSSFPRFAAPGDRFDVPLVVFNNGGQPGDCKVKLELPDGPDGQPNPLRFSGADARAIELPSVALSAGGQAPLGFTLQARESAGVARVRITAAMGGETHEENIELPVRPASPAVTRGGYAGAKGAEPLKLTAPGGLLPGTETLDLQITPWPTLDLPGGLGYLERYPYGCAEQTISTCFPLAYLSDVGRQIAPGVFEPQRVRDKLQSGVIRLIGMQTAEGGIAMWAGSRETWPWASVYAAHFVVEAEAAGHPVPEDFRRRLLGYVRRVLEKGGDDGDLLETQAYACYVLALAGKPDRAAMSRLTELANAPAAGAAALSDSAPQRASAKLFLSLAWLTSGRRDLAAGLVPQTPPAPRAGRQLGGNIGSPVRDRALLVSTMLAVQPEHPALPGLVQQLADAGRDKQWRSTQDAAFAVMAIGRYLRQAKPRQPYDGAELWLGGQKLMAGGKAEPLSHRATASAAAGEFLVRLSGGDSAEGYVTWLQSGVPLAPPPDADAGMKVRRRYLDERGKPVTGGKVRSGDLLRVELSVEAPPGQPNLVVEDLLPAGLEIENPRLNSATAHDLRRPPRPDEVHFEESRLDVRDDRLVLVGAMPGAAVAKYTYLVRAVAPGTFVVPPVRAECMYDIAVNSLSGGGGTLVVEPAR